MIEQLQLHDLATFWTGSALRTYIAKQITQADLKISSITTHQLCLSYYLPLNQFSKSIITFLITLSRGFPATPPRVYSADSFITPSIKSYCNYLTPIIKQNWTVTSQLKLITDAIPAFVHNLYLQKSQRNIFYSLGTYHREKYYDYGLLKQLSEHGPFIGFQTGQQAVNMYVISVTSVHFLLYKPLKQPYFQEHKLIVPKQHEIDTMRIEFMAQIQSLTCITHDRQIKHEYTFQFRGTTDKDIYQVYQKKLKISKSVQMIQTLLKSVKNFKINIDAALYCVQKNSEQDQLLSEMRLMEQKVRHYFNKSTVKELNQSYQKLVQYYSSVGLPYQQIYLQKMTLLHCREDVNLILSTPSPTKPRP